MAEALTNLCHSGDALSNSVCADGWALGIERFQNSIPAGIVDELAQSLGRRSIEWAFKGANYFNSCRMLAGPALFCPGLNLAWRHRIPHSQRVLLCLRRQLLNANREERKWKK